MAKGISEGRRDDLTGGGLIRSHGGWAAVKHMRRAKMFEKSDERILGGVNHECWLKQSPRTTAQDMSF